MKENKPYVICVWYLGEWERKIRCKTEIAAKRKSSYYLNNGYTKTKTLYEP